MSMPEVGFDFEGQWSHWQRALEGDVAQTAPGYAASGFYRTRHGDAVAVWRSESGELFCNSTARFKPKTDEQIDQTITADGCRAITHEIYTARIETGLWPDDVEPANDRGIGDNLASLAPHEQIAEEVRDLLERFQSWLKSIGGKITAEEQDAKAANYAKAIKDLEKKASDTHKREKEPFLEGGRKIDGTWKPVIANAESARKSILAPTTDYRIARDDAQRKAREAEIARQRDEQYRARAEAAQRNEPPAPVHPVSMPPPKATGLRTVKRVVIRDLPALAAQIASFKEADAEFVDVCSKIARRMLLAKADVSGAELVDDKVPA